jgi:hypothetical protein
MAKPYGMFRAKCGHEGCAEFVRYEADRRSDYIDLERRYGNGQWRCVRHSQPNEVLSQTNTIIVREMKAMPAHSTMFWGQDRPWNGFAHGPGFKAFAEDFPEGTILRVTAEIVSPAKESAE